MQREIEDLSVFEMLRGDCALFCFLEMYMYIIKWIVSKHGLLVSKNGTYLPYKLPVGTFCL